MIRGIILLIALAGVAVMADEEGFFSEETQVIQLKDSNFEENINSPKRPWFIKVYAPWCGHCKRLAPIWKELASELKGKVNIAAIDATSETVLARRFRVSGYPSLYFTEDGINYMSFPRGPRDLDSLRKFALEGYKTVPESETKQLGDGSFTESLVESFTYTLKALLQMIDRFFINNGWKVWSDTSKIVVIIGMALSPFVIIGLCACFCCKEPKVEDDEFPKEKEE